MASIIIDDPNYEEPITYYMDSRLKSNCDTKIIPGLEKKDKDYFVAIDGMEGSGKSTLAFQVAKHVDPSFNLDRVVFNAEDFRQAIYKAKKGQAIVFDEAFTGLSSRSALSGINRALVGLMMQMRQKNLFVIIVLPTFFLLDKYVALWRCRGLIHVYESGGRRGYFRVFGRRLKKMLYLSGSKTYSYHIKTRFKGRFYGKFALGDDECEKKYRKKKEKALEDNEKNPMTPSQVRYMQQRNILVYILRKNYKLSYRAIEEMIKEYDIEMSYVQIRNICLKFGDKDKKTDEKDTKEVEMPEIDEKEADLDDS